MRLTKITEENLKKRLGRAVTKSPTGQLLVAAFFNEGVEVPPEIKEWQFPGAIEMDFSGKIEDGRLWGAVDFFRVKAGRLVLTVKEVGVQLSAIGSLLYYPKTQKAVGQEAMS